MHRILYAPQHEPTKRRKHRRATAQVLQRGGSGIAAHVHAPLGRPGWGH